MTASVPDIGGAGEGDRDVRDGTTLGAVLRRARARPFFVWVSLSSLTPSPELFSVREYGMGGIVLAWVRRYRRASPTDPAIGISAVPPCNVSSGPRAAKYGLCGRRENSGRSWSMLTSGKVNWNGAGAREVEDVDVGVDEGEMERLAGYM